jgi:hypothetical protein
MFTSSASYYDKVTAAQARAEANNANSKSAENTAEVESLRRDMDRLMMICEALWGFLKDKHGYTDEQLNEAVKTIDLRDGQLDGKTTQPAATPCPNCGKINSARRPRCIYCGTPLPVNLFAG